MDLAKAKIIPIIISGGTGKRLWPLSRENAPKPYLKLYNSKSLLQNTVLRCQHIPSLSAPIVVANIDHKFITLSQLNEIHANNITYLFESESHNTAPSIAAATEYARVTHGENTLLLIMPVDHIIEDSDGLAHSIEAAIYEAMLDKIVLFGIKPLSANTNYGYIKVDKSIQQGELFFVNKFLEKPEPILANQYYSDDQYYWNSGIYLSSATRLVSDFKKYHPMMFSECASAIVNSEQKNNILELPLNAYTNCPEISVDYAITEQASDMMMVELKSNWQDMGSWESLYAASHKDENQNVVYGNVNAFDTHNSYIRSETDKLILMMGMQNCYVIQTRDAILIADKKSLSQLPDIIATMSTQGRSEVSMSTTVFKPWGSYSILESSVNLQIKKLVIQPHQAISLQEHQFRSEHWIIIKGKATVTLGNTVSTLGTSESIFVPTGMRHRIENHEETTLEIIEIQTGSYLGEDDIIRYDDIYARACILS